MTTKALEVIELLEELEQLDEFDLLKTLKRGGQIASNYLGNLPLSQGSGDYEIHFKNYDDRGKDAGTKIYKYKFPTFAELKELLNNRDLTAVMYDVVFPKGVPERGWKPGHKISHFANFSGKGRSGSLGKQAIKYT